MHVFYTQDFSNKAPPSVTKQDWITFKHKQDLVSKEWGEQDLTNRNKYYQNVDGFQEAIHFMPHLGASIIENA